MSELLYHSEQHLYELDGELLPSVSEVIRFVSREHYADINPVYIQRAAERGTRIHDACEQLDLTGECEVDEEIEPYVEAYAAFLRDYKPKWTHIETAMYHPTKLYAGRIDRAGIVTDKPMIVDIKSSAQPYIPAVKAQLGGYWEMPPGIYGIAMLQVRKDRTYRYKEYSVAEAIDLFDACYALHKATERKRRRKT